MPKDKEYCLPNQSINISVNPTIKNLHPNVKNYISELEKENRNLHKKIAQLEVKHLSAKNRVIAQEKEFKKFQQENPPLDKAISDAWNKRKPKINDTP